MFRSANSAFLKRFPRLPGLLLQQCHPKLSRATSGLLQKTRDSSRNPFSPHTIHTSTAMSQEEKPSPQLSEKEWKDRLPPEQYRVLRLQATEPAYTGAYDKHYPERGTYNCAGCGAPLYGADQKFNSRCGWPAYWDSLPGAVATRGDADGSRTEAVCKKCGGHLGHVFFGEGFGTPTDARHCINSASLRFHDK